MATQTIILNRLRNKNINIYAAVAILLGVVAAGVAYAFDPLYTILGLAGVVFFYLLIFHVEIAILFFLFAQNTLSQYNYLGGGTPFHPNGILGVSVIAGTVWYFIYHPIERARLRGNTPILAFLFLCIMQLAITTISGVNSGHISDQLNVLVRLFAALSIYLVFYYKINSLKVVQWVVGIVVAAQFLPTLNGLLLSAGTSGFSFFQYAETARLGNSGVGVYLAFILILCAVFFFNTPNGRTRTIWGFLSVFYLLGLFFSFGRAGWISFVVGLAVIGILRHRRLFLMLPLLLLLAVGNIPAITQRFAETSTVTLRISIWEAAWGLFLQNPVLGTGYGTGLFLVGDYLRQYSWRIHNDYLSVLLETGLVGFSLFLIWHSQWILAVFNGYRKAKFDYDRILMLAVFAVLIVSMVSRATDNVLVDTYKMYPLSALVGASMALLRIRADAELNTASTKITGNSD
jgi:O-antigen ligase